MQAPLRLSCMNDGQHISEPVQRMTQAPGLADEDGSNHTDLPKIVVGVCAMDRKACNDPDLSTSCAYGMHACSGVQSEAGALFVHQLIIVERHGCRVI